MRILKIQPYTTNSNYRNKINSFSDSISFAKSAPHTQKNNQKLTDKINQAKINLWLSSGIPTRRNLKAFISDPKAYLFELTRPTSGKIVQNDYIAEVDIKNRKTKQKEKAKVQKVLFEDGSSIFAIKKGIERLAFIDVEMTKDKRLYVDFASTIVGRDDYNGLFLTLMQTAVEDCVNNGFIPEIISTPSQVGNKQFNRATLYSIYGAQNQIIEGEFGHEIISIISKDKVTKMLENIQNSQKRNFIFESTEKNFNRLKQNT